jgi:hypothetical protein
LFLLVTWGIVRGVRRQPERIESSVRKWLTYIALVIAASTVIGDIVTFLAYLLRGDLDTRFVLKVVTVLVIAGGVFAYYLDSLRRESVSSGRNRSFAIAALAVVTFGIVIGFAQIGSPAAQRSASEDARRLFDLSSVARALHGRWLSRGQRDFVLPSTIEDLNTGLGGAGIVDPMSGRTYGYVPSPGTAYRLCAEFSRPSPADAPSQWRHRAGSVCFSLDASASVDAVQRQW